MVLLSYFICYDICEKEWIQLQQLTLNQKILAASTIILITPLTEPLLLIIMKLLPL